VSKYRLLGVFGALSALLAFGGVAIARPIGNPAAISIAADTDGDGISDAIEKKGPYKAAGGNFKHKDLWVECDYMKGRQLNWNKMQSDMAKSYARGPVTNPDGKKGIKFHLVVGEQLKLDKTAWAGNLETNAEFENLYNKVMQRRQLSFVNDPDIDSSYFHYCLVVHTMTTNGGLLGISMDSTNINGGIPGDTVALAFNPAIPDNDKTWRRAGTMMHELGHNLGLKHGGFDHVNNKLNYLSIMDYLLTDGFFKKVSDTRAEQQEYWDYSISKQKDLNEKKLNENNGVDAAPSLVAKGFVGIQRCPDSTGQFLQLFFFEYNKPVNFNCNDKFDAGTIKFNINWDGNSTGGDLYSVHKSENNWANIVFDGGAIAGAGASAPSEKAPWEGEPDGLKLNELRKQSAGGLRRFDAHR